MMLAKMFRLLLMLHMYTCQEFIYYTYYKVYLNMFSI